MAIKNYTLTTTATDCVFAPGAISAATSIIICNTHATETALVTVYAQEAGAAAADGNTILKDFSLLPGETYGASADLKTLILGATDKISMKKGAQGTVAITLSTMAL